ncbi:MAG: amino acid adenylation domain-containing protein, partial [Gammaproteobacteria bacterium]
MPTKQTARPPQGEVAAAYPRDMTLVGLFAAQAAQTPDATVVICGGSKLSFGELDAASSRLAGALLERGLAPATRIAVILDRSPDLIVALLAVLKAGSAYIPLDPAYPAERLAHVFGNSRPAAVITRESLAATLPLGQLPVIRLDTDALSSARHGGAGPFPGPLPDDLAYIMYTSGSTGRPKGVQIRHRALVNLLWSLRTEPGLTSRDVLAAVTTISFDMSVPEIFLPLVTGATIILAREAEVKSGAALRALLREHRVTVMQATPITWQLLLEAGWRGEPPLRMWCGGEALPRKLAEALLGFGGELWNLYGPTETTVWSSVLRVATGTGPVPLGPPLANTQFHVLDERGEPAAPGAPGELYIGGDGVAPGYFDLPVETEARFVDDPFGADRQAKLYRTGDIVRIRPGYHGRYTLDFLGRADHQVKLRGVRIELGEIESVLLGQPGIAEAVAVLGQDPAGEGTIRAYVVRSRGSRLPEGSLLGELRAALGRALPAYMHPSRIIVLEALPRTPNGKIDRNGLPAPETLPQNGAVPPLLNDLEQRVAA